MEYVKGKGKSILVVGMTDTGKTFEVKKLLKAFSNLTPLVYDVNNEYGYPYREIEDFLEQAKDTRKSIIVFEEATIFFGSKSSDKMLRETLVKKSHNNNVVVLCFHGLRYVPNDILALVDYVYIKKTNDNSDYIKKKFKDEPHIFNGLQKAKESKNKYVTIKTKNRV